MTAREAWDRLVWYRRNLYDPLSAMYSGDHTQLKATGTPDSFWRRKSGKCKLHVPIASDIAATSADLLFGEEPRFTVDGGNENGADAAQVRLDDMAIGNGFMAKLLEGAESAAAIGDVYYKIIWTADGTMPAVDVVQGDCAYPEYRLGTLSAVHFFHEIARDLERGRVTRAYELYTVGQIETEIYIGTDTELGAKQPDAVLQSFGLSPVAVSPVNEMLAVHVANMRPNRLYRGSMMGRSDMDGLRDLCDALDETYSSWVRDIRLAKARAIIPVEYLKRKPQEMIDGVAASASWEFDEDVETYVAMDIDTEKAGAGITLSQFAIRAQEHAATASQLTMDILSHAGYSPQTFGYEIGGSASSGTALSIREKKSTNTRNKKQVYWQPALETILSTLCHLDAALYPGKGSRAEEYVTVAFAEGTGDGMQTIAQTINMLDGARAISTELKVKMQHPDWVETDIDAEVERIKAENGTALEPPVDIGIGDLEGGGGDDD